MRLTNGCVLLAAVALAVVFPGCHSTRPPQVLSITAIGPTLVGDQDIYTGLVSSVSGACPSLRFGAGSRSVMTIRTTTYQGAACTDVKPGALLTIQGRPDGDGTMLAERVAFENDGPASPGLLSQIASGGYVLFFRHTERNAAALAIPALASADNQGACMDGSQLTQKGIDDATALGQRFRRYGISVERVVASPACRTTEMAALAFAAYETSRALSWPGMWSEGEGATLALELRKLIGTRPAGRGVIVLVSHNDVLQSARVGADVTLDQGEAAVFRPRGGESFDYLGKIPMSEWLGKP